MIKTNLLKAMGIQPWLLRQPKPPMQTETPTTATQAHGGKTQDWQQLQSCVADCKKCPLHQTRTQTVFGVGSEQADCLIIGEAPGANEDKQGKPFVGRAGLLLNEMLRAIGLSREQVFIANILKCRPPNNRDPKPEEVSQCIPYLLKQIDYLSPKLIVAVGRIAAQNLLNRKDSLSRMRNQTFYYHDTPVMVTYHPAYLLRSPQDKRKAYQDLQRIQTFLNSVSHKCETPT